MAFNFIFIQKIINISYVFFFSFCILRTLVAFSFFVYIRIFGASSPSSRIYISFLDSCISKFCQHLEIFGSLVSHILTVGSLLKNSEMNFWSLVQVSHIFLFCMNHLVLFGVPYFSKKIISKRNVFNIKF